ncbi:hypothetical protein, partial [Alistipes shahii]|uniref:hypothetical protein n=1 Tax=Alistipes shahii TaxID=328814 RepID=UPI001E286F3E
LIFCKFTLLEPYKQLYYNILIYRTPLKAPNISPLARKDREGFGTGASQKTCQADSTSGSPGGWVFDIGLCNAYCFMSDFAAGCCAFRQAGFFPDGSRPDEDWIWN